MRRIFPLQRLRRRSMTRRDPRRAEEVVQRRTTRLEVAHPQVASLWSATLVLTEEVPGGRLRQDRVAQQSPMAAIRDTSGHCPSDTVTRADEVSKSATSSKCKSSGSVSRNETEERLRRQLQHSKEKLERSEQARTELESRLNLYQDALTHRDQQISNRSFPWKLDVFHLATGCLINIGMLYHCRSSPSVPLVAQKTPWLIQPISQSQTLSGHWCTHCFQLIDRCLPMQAFQMRFENKGGPENPKAKRQQTNLSNNWCISFSPLASFFLEDEPVWTHSL